MTSPLAEIRGALDRIRSRWQRLALMDAVYRGSLGVAAVLAFAIVLGRWASHGTRTMAALGLCGAACVVAAIAWAARRLRDVPTDRALARFVEERQPQLEDRLVSAVDLMRGSEGTPGLFAGPLLADAARAVSSVDFDDIVPRTRLRRATGLAAAGIAVVLLAAVAVRDVARQSFDAALVTLFPSRLTVVVVPGDVRLEAGKPLTIEARIVGSRAPIAVRLLQSAAAADEDWRPAEMKPGQPQQFTFAFDAVHTSFKYRVAAGDVTSRVYDVTVARAPRVARVDVEYRYPPELGLPPRIEQDSGDIYAPAGTEARVHVHTDVPVAGGRMMLAPDKPLALTSEGDNVLTGAIRVVEDASYRLALAGRDGLNSAGDTEYFIRVLADRPPEVHIVKPARDRSVTRLEEVNIEAQADDDYGIDRVELVYGVNGTEKVVPLPVPRHATSMTGSYMLALEELDVKPGDLVSYYVRARDVTRGRRANEARSDLFFLDVRPFEREFALSQNQGNGGSSSVDDLVAAQKEVVVATWKLDRRGKAAEGARSEQDIRNIGHAESELQGRVQQMSSSFRESTMRDPRRPGRGNVPRAGQTLPEEDAMGAAAAAMGRAVGSLTALNTSGALTPELQALNLLMKAQGDVKKRQISNQQAGAGNANNRSNEDTSTLFDKELQRQQQTNYENRQSAEASQNSGSMLDKVRDLARRQDELNRQQQELADRQRQLSAEELQRELERLTREQSDLRQRAEDLARQMNEPQNGQDASRQEANRQQQGRSGQQPSGGSQQTASGQRGSTAEQGASAERGDAGRGGGSAQGARQAGAGSSGQQMRDASEDMRSATGDLRRQSPADASQRGARALEKLQALQRQLQNGAPDDARRAMGDLQLEARQLADAERQAASEIARSGRGGPGSDALRRLAGEQERLADRADRVEQRLKQAAGAAGSRGQPAGAGSKGGDSRQRAAADGAREIDRQRLTDRMRQAAEQLRSAAGQGDGARPDANGTPSKMASAAATEQALAQAFDKLADSLTSGGAGDDASRKLSEQRTQAQGLRSEIDRLSSELEKAQARGAQPSGGRSARKSAGDTGSEGGGRAGGGAGGPDLAQLRDEYTRQLEQTRELMRQLQHDDPTFAQGGSGLTFDGQGMTLSSPGTEAFKQDFTRWQQLRQQATEVLTRAEQQISKKLQEKEAHDRFAAGVDDKAPASYQNQVDEYFKALANSKSR